LIETARRWIRDQPKGALTRWFVERTAAHAKGMFGYCAGKLPFGLRRARLGATGGNLTANDEAR
jgi:hypothetical protein